MRETSAGAVRGWTLGGALALWLAGAACGGGGDGSADGANASDTGTADSTAMSGDSTEAATGVDAGASPANPSAEDPFRGFDLPSENGTGEMRRYRLRLRNDGDSLAIVYADGGAGEVLLDSVPAGSWRPVEVDSRAHIVRLRSETPGGAMLREAELGAPADTAVDLAVGPRQPAE